MITDEQLREWKALEDKATSGPWQADNLAKVRCATDEWKGLIADVGDGRYYNSIPRDIAQSADNAAFIAASRTAVPALCEEAERLKEVIERLGSSEAFVGARALDKERDKELIARMDFARSALQPARG